MKTELRDSTDGRYYSAVVGGNGNEVFVSKMYSRKWNCRRTAAKLPFPIIDRTKTGHNHDKG